MQFNVCLTKLNVNSVIIVVPGKMLTKISFIWNDMGYAKRHYYRVDNLLKLTMINSGLKPLKQSRR